MNFRLHNPLPLIVALVTMLLAPALAPGATAPLSENPQRGAQPFAPASRQADATLSPASHQGYASAYGELASESLLAPKSAASRFGDRSWKNLIEGQAHGTNAHKIRTYREAIRMAKSGQYERVYINKALSTASGKQVNSLLRPDVTGVRPGGLMDMIEVPHPGQTPAQMWDKISGMEELLGGMAGPGSNVVPIR